VKKILRSYHCGMITEDEAVVAMTQHIFNKGLDSYLTSELLNMVSRWRKGKVATWQLEKIS